MPRARRSTRWDGGVIRVVIADDHTVIQQALSMVLGQQNNIEVVATASNGREALLAAEQYRPHVVFMDLFMPGMGGIEATTQLKRYVPGTKIVVLTGAVNEDQVIESVRAGADGYVSKNAGLEELMRAMGIVLGGGRYFARELERVTDIATIEQRALKENGRNGLELLTQREREVLQLIGEGHSNQGIADELSVSIKTVEAHRAHLRDKLKARNRRDLIVAAMRAGLVEDASSGRNAAAG